MNYANDHNPVIEDNRLQGLKLCPTRAAGKNTECNMVSS